MQSTDLNGVKMQIHTIFKPINYIKKHFRIIHDRTFHLILNFVC